MKEAITIVAMSRENGAGEFDGLTSNVYATPAEAMKGILAILEEEAKYSKEDIVLRSGSRKGLFNEKEGTLDYTVGGYTFHFHFLNVPGEYNVSDQEVVKALDAFCNSNRSQKDFERVAQGISLNMHRYIQNELWKFVKHLVRAFAVGRYDQRNRTAHDQAQDIELFMEEKNM